MKFRINPLASDILISVYAVVSLFVRFKYENQINVSAMHSLVIGISFALILYALIKLKVLNPNWFGLFNRQKS